MGCPAGRLLVGALTCALAALPQTAGKAPDPTAFARGKRTFAARCASCHAPDGTKEPDPGLTPLSQRSLREDDMRANIRGRLGPQATDEDRRAMELFVRSIVKEVRKP